MCVSWLLQGLLLIPYKDLGLSYRSEVLGHSRHGLVLQADYNSMSTAVKPLLPSLQPKTVTPFVPRNTALHGLSGLSEEAELPHATHSLNGSPTVPSRPLTHGGDLIDFDPEHGLHTSKWRSLLVRRCTSISQLIIAASRDVAAVPGYILTIVNGTRWRQARMRQKVTI